jgi:anti-anti-sigma factor
VVSVRGDFDLSVLMEGRQALTAAVHAANNRPVIVDLSQVAFLDSSGISALLAGMNAAHEAAVSYRVSGASGLVERILDITGLLALLTDQADSTSA